MNKRNKNICILCEEEVKPDDKIYVLPVEKPVRINFIVHRGCFKKSDENARKMAVKQVIFDRKDEKVV